MDIDIMIKNMTDNINALKREFEDIISDNVDLYRHAGIRNLMKRTQALYEDMDDAYSQDRSFMESWDSTRYSGILMDSDAITIEPTDDGYHIVLPRLLPKRDSKSAVTGYPDEYRRPILAALQREFPGQTPIFYTKVIIMIVHNYSADQLAIDHDNFDYSHLINCLTTYFLLDDGPAYTDLLIVARNNTRSFTEVYLFPEEQIGKYWNAYLSKE